MTDKLKLLDTGQLPGVVDHQKMRRTGPSEPSPGEIVKNKLRSRNVDAGQPTSDARKAVSYLLNH